MVTIEKIASGGQTGADGAALDFTIEHGIPHGWCPRGRKGEDGAIDARYQRADYANEIEPGVVVVARLLGPF